MPVWIRVLLFACAALTLSAAGPVRAQDEAGRDMYAELRTMALDTPPGDLGLEGMDPRTAYGVIMEIEIDGETATIVTFATGDASLYLSTGGGVIGGVGHASVQTAAQALVARGDAAADRFEPATGRPRPGPGEVRFYLLRADGLRTAAAPRDELVAGRHPLSSLFFAGNDVITALRLASE